MTSLYFVTPAHRRYDLTAVCLEQRRQVIDTLAAQGIEAQCVVIADDENLDIARGLGFATVERPNEHRGKVALGRKFNDGIEYAARHGADFIVPIGSDSWIDPAYFLPLPDPSVVRTASEYAPVERDRLAAIDVHTTSGAGPYVFPRALLEPSGFRPAEDYIPRGVDGSTIRGIEATTGEPIPWQRYSLHPLQYVGFRGETHITSYEKLRERWGVWEAEPAELETVYPADLVARALACLPERPVHLIDSRGLRWMGRRITHGYRTDHYGRPIVALCGVAPHENDEDRPKADADFVCGKCRVLSKRIPQKVAAA